MTHFWFIIAISCIILELINLGLFLFLPIGFAAVITSIALSYDILPCDQYLFFTIISLTSFLIVKKWLSTKYLQNKYTHYQSNAQALIGKTITITQILEHNRGYGKINGEVWQAELTTSEALIIDQSYIVVAVQGIRLIVTQISNHLQS